VDVVAEVGASEAALVGWSIGAPAVDELGRPQRLVDSGELSHELAAGPVRVPRQPSPSTAPMSTARPALWLHKL
jgi:hypothetical protein